MSLIDILVRDAFTTTDRTLGSASCGITNDHHPRKSDSSNDLGRFGLPRRSSLPPTFNANNGTVPLAHSLTKRAVAASKSRQIQQNIVVMSEAFGKQAFHDPRNAALFTLLSTGIPLIDFVDWVSTERSSMLVSPITACQAPTWKFLLLRDNSLSQLKPQHDNYLAAKYYGNDECLAWKLTNQLPMSSSTTVATISSAGTDDTSSSLASSNAPAPLEQPSFLLGLKDPPHPRADIPALATTPGGPFLQCVAIADPPNGKTKRRLQEEQETTVSRPRRAVTMLMESERKQESPTVSLLSGNRTTGSSAQKQTKKLKTGHTEPTEQQSEAKTKQRGSARRLPELEGVTDCPECKRKGQSIFDPNNWNSEGLVWQYFYCRNSECVKGKSSNRYIGWTTRPKVISPAVTIRELTTEK